jgi:hypothetical protein
LHLADGITTVASGGTPVVLASSGAFEWLYIMAHDDNTGMCHVGASSVVSAIAGTARGTLVPQQFASAAEAFVPLRIDGPASMNSVFVDAVTDGDSVTWFGMLAD